MFWRTFALAVASVIIASAVGNVALADPIYTLTFFDVDDTMSAYITNSAYKDQLAFQVTFGQEGPVNGGNISADISSYVEPGLNDLFIQDYNGPSGWTYGYDFAIDGTTIASGSCAGEIWNTFGCDNNIQSEANQIVFSTDVKFNGPSAPTPVPEPSSLALLASGLLGAALMRRSSRFSGKSSWQ